jgi:uncharacterized protein (TIGR01777 family)
MKIAVTGGTGFIGRALVDRLAASGHAIVLLTRRPDAAGARQRIEPSFFDVGRPFTAAGLRGAQAVIHLAGEPIARRWTPEVKRRIRESRVAGTTAIAHAAREAGTVEALLSASAIGYYGPRGSEPLTESSPPGDDFLARVCRDWEREALSAAEAGIRTVLLRIGVVLHPEGGALAKMLPLFRLGLGGRFGTGAQYMSWIHREDALGLIVHALNAAAVEGPMNLTAPNPVMNAEFTRAVSRTIGKPAMLNAPSFALRIALGEMSQTVLAGQRVLPQRAQETGFAFRFPEVDAALRDLLVRGRSEAAPRDEV